MKFMSILLPLRAYCICANLKKKSNLSFGTQGYISFAPESKNFICTILTEKLISILYGKEQIQ